MGNDLKYYNLVAQELKSGLIQDGLWIKSLAKSVGDKEIAKSLYIEWTHKRKNSFYISMIR